MNIINKEILDISGMHCASCALMVENALSRLEGVKRTEVYKDLKKVSVEFDDTKTDRDALINKIDSLGYKAITQETKEEEITDNVPPTDVEKDKTSALKNIFRKFVKR